MYVGLDVHKDSITVAYALGMAEVELLGKIGMSKADISVSKDSRIDRWPKSVRFPDTAAQGVGNPDSDCRPPATRDVAKEC